MTGLPDELLPGVLPVTVGEKVPDGVVNTASTQKFVEPLFVGNVPAAPYV